MRPSHPIKLSMPKPNAPRTSVVDSFIERPLLLSDGKLWGGLKFGYFQAADHVDKRHLWLPHPCIGILTSGKATAAIQSGASTTDIAIGSGVAGIFGPEYDVYRSVWHCEDAKRIFIELGSDAYVNLGLADELLARPLHQDLASPDPDLYGVMIAMTDELHNGCPHGRLYSEILVQGLLRHVHNNYGRAARPERSVGATLSRAQLERVREYVQVQLAQELGLSEMASVAGVSRAHFARLFRNTLGQTPHAYVIAERIRRAQHMMVTTDQGLADIAVACGFSSQGHLGTLFRRETGTTPRAFRDSFSSRGRY